MAAVSDCFSLGSTIWCRTCYNKEIEGEVLAFDPQTKFLILKCVPSSGKAGVNDTQFVNLSYVSELQVKREVTNVPESPQSLNLQRLNTRIRNQVDEKRRLLQAMSANVSPEGRSLFIAINKIFKEVRWRNSDIVIWDHQVIITPPYKVDDIRGNSNSKEYGYVKKVVEKHTMDLALNSTVNSQVVQHNKNTQ